MIESSAFRKYLIYALGEIALVVIGILIALQINNWNEERKEKNQIVVYLSGLIDALEDDIVYLNYTIQGNKFRANCIEQLLIWSDAVPARPFTKLNYTVDDVWNPEELDVGWTNKWMNQMPQEYDRSFVEECFFRTSYGNVIVTNQINLEEFKNSGLFSNIRSKELKNEINHYYAIMNWQFSLWRETNYREKIDNWEIFLRDKHQINYTDISRIQAPAGFVRDNRDVQLELESLFIDAAGRVNKAGDIREAAKELIVSIKNYIGQL